MSVRIPQQVRSIQKKQAIMQVARQVFAGGGLDALNSNQIARKAGVSTGTFYSYFEDKEDLMYAVVEDFLDETFRVNFTPVPRGRKPDFYPMCEDYVRAVFEACGKDPAFLRFVLARRYEDPKISEIFDRVAAREIHTMSRIMELYDEAGNLDDYNLAGALIYGLVASGTRTLYTEKTLNRDEDKIISEIARMIYGYLVTPRP